MPRWRWSGTARVAGSLAVATGLVILSATAAQAHAVMISSDPPNGSALSSPPATENLHFDRPVEASLATVGLRDGDGRVVPGCTVVQAGPATLAVRLPNLDDGVYSLSYRVFDTTDLHVTGGQVTFGVGPVAVIAGQSSPSPQPASTETVGRWLDLVGVAIVSGVAFFWLWLLPGLDVDAESRRRLTTSTQLRLRRLLVVGYLGILAGKMAELALATSDLLRESPRTTPMALASALWSTLFAQLWLAGMGLAVLTFVVLERHLRKASGPGRSIFVWTLLGTLTLISAQSGHGATSSGLDPVLALVRWVHLGAAAIWLGGLIVISLALVSTIGPESAGNGAALAMVRRFAAPAGASAIAAVSSGLVLAGGDVYSPHELVTTQYGWTLVAKVAAVGLAMALGLRHFAISRRSVPSPLSLAYAIGAIAVVLWGASTLGATAPATRSAVQLAANQARLQTRTTLSTGDLILDATMDPGRPGSNWIEVQYRGDLTALAGRPFRPVTAMTVTVIQAAAAPQMLTGALTGAHGNIYRFGPLSVPRAGLASLQLVVDRSDGSTDHAGFQWVVSQPAPAATELDLPENPWSLALNLMALCLILGVITGMAAVRLASRHGHLRPHPASATTRP